MKRLAPRIAHGLQWRSNLTRDLIRSGCAQARVEFRWRCKIRQRPHSLPAPLIVSLTSYPPRFRTLSLTLRCLLGQTVKADRTILWIAHADRPLLPDNVVRLQAQGLDIRVTDDIKSYKKIIPTLNVFPNAFICTADDDIYYWPTWLEELVDSERATHRVVACHRVHQITFDAHGNFMPYTQWILDIRAREATALLFPTCGAGALFPPRMLEHTTEDEAAALSLCPTGDDIWLYWISRRNGASYKTVGRQRKLVMWPASQEQTLWRKNMFQGANDEQIRQMIARYGYPYDQPSVSRQSAHVAMSLPRSEMCKE